MSQVTFRKIIMILALVAVVVFLSTTAACTDKQSFLISSSRKSILTEEAPKSEGYKTLWEGYKYYLFSPEAADGATEEIFVAGLKPDKKVKVTIKYYRANESRYIFKTVTLPDAVDDFSISGENTSTVLAEVTKENYITLTCVRKDWNHRVEVVIYRIEQEK